MLSEMFWRAISPSAQDIQNVDVDAFKKDSCGVRKRRSSQSGSSDGSLSCIEVRAVKRQRPDRDGERSATTANVPADDNLYTAVTSTTSGKGKGKARAVERGAAQMIQVAAPSPIPSNSRRRPARPLPRRRVATTNVLQPGNWSATAHPVASAQGNTMSMNSHQPIALPQLLQNASPHVDIDNPRYTKSMWYFRASVALSSLADLGTDALGNYVCMHDPCCGKVSCKRMADLKRHVKNMHLGERVQCPHCDQILSRNDAYTRHCDTMHRGLETLPPIPIKAASK